MEIKKVIIGKGEIPKSCYDCGFTNGRYYDCNADIHYTECKFLGRTQIDHGSVHYYEKLPDCPLEEEE